MQCPLCGSQGFPGAVMYYCSNDRCSNFDPSVQPQIITSQLPLQVKIGDRIKMKPYSDFRNMVDDEDLFLKSHPSAYKVPVSALPSMPKILSENNFYLTVEEVSAVRNSRAFKAKEDRHVWWSTVWAIGTVQ